MAAGYDVEAPFKGHAEVIVTLVKTDSQWLVSDMVEGQQADAKVEVLVQDEAGVPVAGAKVTIGNAEKELIRTEMTDDAGLAVFGTVPAPDAILTTTTVKRPRGGGSFVAGEPYKVRLRSVGSMAQKKEHVVLTAVDPPLLVIPQNGSAKAMATVYSFNRPSRMSLRLQERSDPSTRFSLESTPGR